MTDPVRAATLLQLAEITRHLARVLSSYRAQLEEGGMGAAEAWALTQRLEERLMGPLIDAAAPPPEMAPETCPECSGDKVLDVSGDDGRAWLCLDVACLHHWRGGE